MGAPSIPVRDRLMLWGRAAHRCAVCREELLIDAAQGGGGSLIGDAAHVVGESMDGPRGNSPMSPEERNSYANTILLCKNHHKMVDDLDEEYTVQRLHEMKANHERWVKDNLSVDFRLLHDIEVYASYIDQWLSYCGRQVEWRDWTESLVNERPHLNADRYQRLQELSVYLQGRVWSSRYPRFESSLRNFQRVLNDLLVVFNRHAEKDDDAGSMNTPRFYRSRDWDPPLYRRLVMEWQEHVDLVADYVLELTRSANLIMDRVRESFDPAFALDDGVFMVIREMKGLTWGTLRVEYTTDERSRDEPYPGLKAFRGARFSRDQSIGDPPVPKTSTRRRQSGRLATGTKGRRKKRGS